MKASTEDAPPRKGRNEGWGETVLIWNATVATIPAPAVPPGPAQDVDESESRAAL
jgi:hypothetical protein